MEDEATLKRRLPGAWETIGEIAASPGVGMFGMILVGALFFMMAMAIAWTVLGVHALLLGRMPGHWLPRLVRQPRVWGAGALLMVVSWNQGSPSLLVVGIGLVALGHVMKSES